MGHGKRELTGLPVRCRLKITDVDFLQEAHITNVQAATASHGNPARSPGPLHALQAVSHLLPNLTTVFQILNTKMLVIVAQVGYLPANPFLSLSIYPTC